MSPDAPLPASVTGVAIQLKRPLLPLPELLPALLEEELRRSASTPVHTPIFFVLRGRTMTRFELGPVPAVHRDGLARELGRGAAGVAMFAGVAGQPATWAFKIESPRVTCTVIVVLRDGVVLARRL